MRFGNMGRIFNIGVAKRQPPTVINEKRPPGGSVFGTSPGGRRWMRERRISMRAAEQAGGVPNAVRALLHIISKTILVGVNGLPMTR